jgi:hypothetical protein
MTKMPITGEEALTLLNGFRRGERRDTMNVRRVVLLVLIVLSLGIVIPLFPDIRRYLRIQRM